jgi:photosynthetic reaction center cytochrome c subunit
MASFRTALGVGCDHCHVPGNWASDDRIEKVMARVMADMRWNLEATYFMGRTAVTCWTCHRGAITPQTSLPAALMP